MITQEEAIHYCKANGIVMVPQKEFYEIDQILNAVGRVEKVLGPAFTPLFPKPEPGKSVNPAEIMGKVMSSLPQLMPLFGDKNLKGDIKLIIEKIKPYVR